jgi:fatty-acyl-CoA synthase
VGEIAVIGIPDEKLGERPLALVVPHPEYRDSITPEELRNVFLGHSEKGMIPTVCQKTGL